MTLRGLLWSAAAALSHVARKMSGHRPQVVCSTCVSAFATCSPVSVSKKLLVVFPRIKIFFKKHLPKTLFGCS